MERIQCGAQTKGSSRIIKVNTPSRAQGISIRVMEFTTHFFRQFRGKQEAFLHSCVHIQNSFAVV
jgi:hypothetical protein